jgi:hypothetical protein
MRPLTPRALGSTLTDQRIRAMMSGRSGNKRRPPSRWLAVAPGMVDQKQKGEVSNRHGCTSKNLK